MKGRLENQIKIEAKIEDLLSHNDEIFRQFSLNLNTNTAKTKHQYLLSILYFFEHCNKLNPRKVSTVKLRQISKIDIQRFLEKDKYYTSTNGETRLKSPATVARQIAVLKNFFQFCLREGYITDDPTRDIKNPKRNNETEVVYMTPADMKHVKDNIRRGGGDWISRDLAIFTLGQSILAEIRQTKFVFGYKIEKYCLMIEIWILMHCLSQREELESVLIKSLTSLREIRRI